MDTSQLYVFEAGSTKTDVYYFDGKTSKYLTLSGFNPNRLDTKFKSELKKLSISPKATIYFYGSGVNSTATKDKINSMFNSTNIYIFSDILGAARAALTNSKGIISIMGTGGVVAYYDGTKITSKFGGYGYLIDDFGGGLELSKIIVSNWLNNNYNIETSNAITTYFNINPTSFISNFYNTKNLHKLSGVCVIIPSLATNDANLHESIQNYFNTFTKRHVLPLAKLYNIEDINLVGSIAYHFKPWIKKSFSLSNLKIKSTLLKPVNAIFNYHLNKDNSL